MESSALRLEVEYLHRQMFYREAPQVLIDGYLRAHSEIAELHCGSAQELRTLEVARTNGLDALGIEPWLRRPNHRHPLTIKLLLLSYLAECDALHPEFAHGWPGAGRLFIPMAGLGIMALVRLVHGGIQKARYGLA